MRQQSLRILFIYNGIFVLAGNLLVPLYSVYMQRFESSVLSISIAWGTLLASSTLFSLLLSSMGKHLRGNEHLLMAGYLVRAVAWFTFIFINSMAGLLVLQVLLGLGEALGSPAFDAMFAEKVQSTNKIAQYSQWKLISNLMTAVGTVLGGVIVTWFGFTPLFVMMTALALVSFVGVLSAHTETDPFRRMWRLDRA